MFEYVGIAFMVFFILGMLECRVLTIEYNGDILHIISSVVSGIVAGIIAAISFAISKG